MSENSFPKPSAAAVNSVLALATALQQFGGLLDSSRSDTRTQQLLDAFAVKFVERLQETSECSDTAGVDVAKDLVLLYILVTAWKPEDASISTRLREVAAKVLSQVSSCTL